MANYWQNAEDIKKWVGSRGTADVAAKELIDIIQKMDHVDNTNNHVPEENSIAETCKTIIEHPENEEAANVLLGILASHKLAGSLTKTTKTEVKMEKEAQSQSRQRNGWVRGMRNKWNRVVDGFNDGTPCRIERDKMYDFTHYYTDAISFDEDPTKVYSGEALWRMYVMDKFYADYQDKDGKVVGGYINDRFHRFPTAGTPSVPDTDRHGGNSMELAPGERTRKPRPHQYSTERRLEEARGNKTDALEVAASSGFEKVVKLASTLDPERKQDRVFGILKDTIEMREAGIDYKTMLNAVADHYEASVLGVSQIDKFAQDMVKKHQKVAYHMVKATTIGDILNNPQSANGTNMTIGELGAKAKSSNNLDLDLVGGTELAYQNGILQIVSGPNAGQEIPKENIDLNAQANPIGEFQSAANGLGLNETQTDGVKESVKNLAGQKAGAALESPEYQGEITNADPQQ